MVKLLKELDLKNKIEEELYSEMAKRGYWKDKEPFMDWGYYDDKDIVEIDLNEFDNVKRWYKEILVRPAVKRAWNVPENEQPLPDPDDSSSY